MFKIFKRGQKGFTLVELMVVMGIIALLAGIVVPAVTGTKGPAESTQLKGDANAIQSAASKFNNDSVTGAWPEAAISGVYVPEAALTNSGLPTGSSYHAIDWDATTNIRGKGGELQPVAFVPDFVPKTPASDVAKQGTLHVYVWLFKAGAATDATTRTVEIYKLNDDKVTYTQVY